MKRCFAFFLLLCIFGLPLSAQEPKDGFFLALRYDREVVSALIGNGVAWRVLKQIPRTELGGQPVALRVGKMSLQGDNRDYTMPGETGSCRIENITGGGQTNPNYHPQFKSEPLNPFLAPDKPQLMASPRPETKIEWANGTLKIDAHANSAAFGEWLLHPQIMDEATYSCRVWKESDKGLSWGPGLALIWPDGQFILVNARHPLGEWSVTTREGETLIRS
jgi:hypothetical protein